MKSIHNARQQWYLCYLLAYLVVLCLRLLNISCHIILYVFSWGSLDQLWMIIIENLLCLRFSCFVSKVLFAFSFCLSYIHDELSWFRIYIILCLTICFHQIAEVKEKFRTHIGTSVDHQRLILKRDGEMVCEMSDNSRKLGFYSVVSGNEIHVVDTDPFSLSRGGGLTDTSLIDKYKMDDETYSELYIVYMMKCFYCMLKFMLRMCYILKWYKYIQLLNVVCVCMHGRIVNVQFKNCKFQFQDILW